MRNYKENNLWIFFINKYIIREYRGIQSHTTQSKLVYALETNHRVITPIRKGSKGFDLDGPLNQTKEKALMSSKRKETCSKLR
jgi:hypothetical protein